MSKLFKFNLNKIFFIFILLLISSCSSPSSTSWLFVSQYEVEKLLSSPEEIKIGENTYTLKVDYTPPAYRGWLGKPITPANIRAVIFSSPIEKAMSNNIRFKFKNFWIINKYSGYYFKTQEANILYENFPKPLKIDPSNDYREKREDIGILNFSLNNKEYYLKVQVGKGTWNYEYNN